MEQFLNESLPTQCFYTGIPAGSICMLLFITYSTSGEIFLKSHSNNIETAENSYTVMSVDNAQEEYSVYSKPQYTQAHIRGRHTLYTKEHV